MTYSSEGLELTKHFEGCRLEAYQDSGGVLTIGYGHTAGVKEGDTCTQEQADAWLASELISASEFVLSMVDIELTQCQLDALSDFVFNLGPRRFKYSTLRVLVVSGQTSRAAEEFLRWNHVNGKVVAGLTRRREAEKAMFEGRDWKEAVK